MVVAAVVVAVLVVALVLVVLVVVVAVAVAVAVLVLLVLLVRVLLLLPLLLVLLVRRLPHGQAPAGAGRSGVEPTYYLVLTTYYLHTIASFSAARTWPLSCHS